MSLSVAGGTILILTTRITAPAQQPTMPVVGFINAGAADANARRVVSVATRHRSDWWPTNVSRELSLPIKLGFGVHHRLGERVG